MHIKERKKEINTVNQKGTVCNAHQRKKERKKERNEQFIRNRLSVMNIKERKKEIDTVNQKGTVCNAH